MHGSDAMAGSLFSYFDLEKRVRPDHPLRVMRGLVNSALADLSAALDALYSPFGRGFHSAGATGPRAAVTGFLLAPFGAAIGRAD